MESDPIETLKKEQGGLALVLVLWAVALLTVVAASFAFESRTEAMLAANVVDRVRADAAAEAGIERAVAGLLQPAGSQWTEDEAIRTLHLGGAALRIAVQSAHGKIDLNAGPDALIYGALSRAYAGRADDDGATLAEIVDAVLDWRDRDHARRPDGAEDEDYYRLGRRFGAADQSFVRVSELLQVRGITQELFQKVAGLFTVHTRSPRINPESASREVLLSIPGLTANAVDDYLEARTARREAASPDEVPRAPIELLVGGATYLTRNRPSIYEILVEAQLAGGQVSRRGAVIRLTRNRRQPYQVLAWLLDSDARFGVFESRAEGFEVQ